MHWPPACVAGRGSRPAVPEEPASLTEKAPDTYKVRLDTSAGPVVIQVTRAWAPLGADRFYNLVKNGFYDDVRFFRVIPGFMAQGGMSGDPAIQKLWGRNNFNDDPVKQSNKRGYRDVCEDRRRRIRARRSSSSTTATTRRLDAQGFAPFGQVTSGMEAVDKFEARQERPGPGHDHGRGQRLSAAGLPEADRHQEGHHREVKIAMKKILLAGGRDRCVFQRRRRRAGADAGSAARRIGACVPR